jgi:phosphoenolpyruvate carboxylase
VEALELPRAIGYTGSLYTMCLPPEFMGTGRGLLELSRKNKDMFEALLKEYYPSLPADLEFAGRFLDLKKARHFLPQDVIRNVTEDIDSIRELLSLEFEPDPSYSAMVSIIEPYLSIMHSKVKTLPAMELAKLDSPARDLLSKLGKMRGSLG